MGVNHELLKLANWRVQEHLEKQAIVPPGGGDPMAGGAPPMGGPPMGGPPPMDPMAGGPPPKDPMAGGPPPMDPMAGGAPPPEDVRSIIQEELANAGVGGNGAAAAGPAGAKAKKFDPEELNTKLYNMEKLIVAISNALGVSLPPEALLGPPPEGATPPEGAEGPAPAPGPEGPGSSIKPIEPIQPAMPEAPGDGGGDIKIGADTQGVPTVGEPISASSAVSASDILNKTAALAQMARSINNRG